MVTEGYNCFQDLVVPSLEENGEEYKSDGAKKKKKWSVVAISGNYQPEPIALQPSYSL